MLLTSIRNIHVKQRNERLKGLAVYLSAIFITFMIFFISLIIAFVL